MPTPRLQSRAEASTVSRTTTIAWSTFACLAAASSGCHRQTEKLKVLAAEGETLELGRELELTPAGYDWSFRASPGDTFHVHAYWPSGRVKIMVGSDVRDGVDDDDATQIHQEEGSLKGAHESEATLRISPKAGIGWIRLFPQGRGVEPIRLRVDRVR
jgi:hypothetical protein